METEAELAKAGLEVSHLIPQAGGAEVAEASPAAHLAAVASADWLVL